MNIDKIKYQIGNEKKIWFVLGAGISISSPSNVPLWGTIKQSILESVINNAVHYDQEVWKNGDRYPFLQLHSNMAEFLESPEAAIEVMCRAYRPDNVQDYIKQIIEKPNLDSSPNFNHKVIAKMCVEGLVAGIITTNFDVLIEREMNRLCIPYKVVNKNNLNLDKNSIPIFKLHGSIDSPNSMIYRNSDYFKGISEPVLNYILQNTVDSNIIILGYSGYDIDVYPLVRKVINIESNQTFVIDVKPIQENLKFKPLQENIKYIQSTAESFLSNLTSIEYTNVTSIPHKPVPSIQNKNIFNDILFISEAFRYNGYGSISVSFLCNDIADDNQSDYQLAISNYALAIASAHSGDNWGAASHFARGHSHFGSIDWEKAEYEQNEPEDFVNHISLWHFEAEKTLAYCALGALFHSKDALIKEKMKKVAELYLHNYDHWSSFYERTEFASDDIALYPNVVSKLLNGYYKLALNEPDYEMSLNESIQISKRYGYFKEMILAINLLRSANSKDDLFRSEIEYVLSNIDVKEDVILTPLKFSKLPFDGKFYIDKNKYGIV